MSNENVVENSNSSEIKRRIEQLAIELADLRRQIVPARSPFQLPDGILSLLSFQIAEQKYALYLPVVTEVIRMVELTPLPTAPQAIAGLLNMRGEILPVIDLRILLGLEAASYQLYTPIIILQCQAQKRAIVVDGVDEIITISRDTLEAPDPRMVNTELMLALLRRDTGIMIILDHSRLLSFEDEQWLDTTLKKSSETT